jgi:integrase
MAKRANGEGNVYQRPNGTWQARISYIDDAGVRRRASFYGPMAAIVRAKMKDARSRIDAGAPVKDATRTVGDWLNHWCATTLAVSGRKETTKSMYASLAKKHVSDLLGSITLDRLRPSDVERLILSLRDRGLSDSTIRSCYSVVRLALDGAVRDGLIARNPAAAVPRPGVARKEARHLDADAVMAVLRAAEGPRYHLPLLLIASTGLRRGECLALPWSAVDLDAGTIKVAATIARVNGRLLISEPKTARSRRTVPISPAVVAMLRKHRTAQLAERLRAGNQWRGSELVFTTRLGGPVEPRHLLQAIETAAARAGVSDVTVHTLRHSAAVAWLENGTHIKAVSDLLGHSSIAITGDTYGHTSADTARAAVDGLAGRLGL